MKKIFIILFTVLFASSLFAATEPAWYNDVTSITANGQYYIYSVNGKAFMQAGQTQVKAITTSNYTNVSTFKFKISAANQGYVTNGSYYLKSYMVLTGSSNSGPVCTKQSDDGTKIIWTSMNSGEYWNIHSYYNAWFADRYPALRYQDNKYDGYMKHNGGVDYSSTKDTQTGTEFRWYLVSQAQLDRHFAIYFFDAYKESLNIAQYENHVPAAYYTALQTAYNQTFSVQNAAHSAEVVNAAKTNLETLYNGAADIAAAYATATAAINALEAIEDKGEDFAEVTADITNARTALEQAMSEEAVNAAVAGLKAIDPITFTVTTFTALEALGTPASTAAGRAITYDAADKTIINAAGQPIHKGTTTLTATAAATNDYYKFVRSAQVTVNAMPTSAEENKTITYGAAETWNGYDLSTYMVGSHSLVYETTNAQGGVHTITLNLTVNKIETLNVPVELAFCPGSSEFYRDTEYIEAGTYDVPAEGATRDTVYQVTVTILEPTSSTETKTIVYGTEEIWNGIALQDSTVGVHTVTYVTENVAGCDSTVTLTLTVNKIATLNVPVALSFCPGGSESYRGTEYTEAGTYDVPAEGATRDTVYQVTVTILEPTSSTETKTIVYGTEEIWNGIALADSTVGVHTVTYVTENAAGCDSTVTLTLTVNKIETLNVPVELAFCAGSSETYRGTEYTEAGVTNVPATGDVRDTTYVVTVTVLEPTSSTEEKTITFGDAEEWNGINLSDSTVGVHTVVFETTNAAGCDSTVTLTLTVNKQETLEVPVALSFCEGDSVEYGDKWYLEAGEDAILAEGDVRDTLYTLTITVNKPDFTELFAQETSGEYFVLPEGVWYLGDSEEIVTEWTVTKADTAGLWFMEYLQNVNGCDSITKFFIAVHVEAPVELHEPLGFCPGDSVEFRGKWYFESGLDTIYVEDAVRDTIIYVEAVLLPIADITVLRDTVLSGHDVILPEGEWIIGEDTVSGAYSTVQSGDASEIVFRQYDDTFEGCGEAYIELIVTLTPNFEAIENVQTDEVQSIKFIRAGVLYIRRGERNYVVDGRLVR